MISESELLTFCTDKILETDDWLNLLFPFEACGFDPDNPTESQIREVVGMIYSSGKLRMLNVETKPLQFFEPGEVDLDALSHEIADGPPLLNMMRYMIDLVRD